MTVLAFTQLRTPVGGVTASTLLTLALVLAPLALLAVFRVTAWAVVISNSVVVTVPAIFVWGMPGAGASYAEGDGATTSPWAVVTGAFDRFKQWLITQATADIRVQTILLTWALGVLLERLPSDRIRCMRPSPGSTIRPNSLRASRQSAQVKEESRWQRKVTLFPAEACCAAPACWAWAAWCRAVARRSRPASPALGRRGTRCPTGTCWAAATVLACRRCRQAYQKQHPNVALSAVVLAWGNPYYTKVSLATLGQRPPDVAISHLTRASILAQAGLLEPLNENELARVRAHRRPLHARGVEHGAHERDPVRDPTRYAPAGDVLQHRHLQEGRAAR